MDNFLHTVIRERRQDAQAAAEQVPFETLQRQVATNVIRRSLADMLRRRGTNIIAEVKKASPSAGVLAEAYRPVELAREYERAGAAAISVLTEPRHFQGSLDDLHAVRQAVQLPVLRKDFIGDPYQVYEAAAMGADAVLLIAAALDFQLLRDLYIVALAIGLDVIIEIHTTEQLEMVLPLARGILGVNSRDLRSLKTDLAVAKELAAYIPPDRLAIAESGIKTRRDIDDLQAVGYKGFLVGEALMRSANAGMYLRGLLGPARHVRP